MNDERPGAQVWEGPRRTFSCPHIHFSDEEWLKMMVLYWDRLARIVQGGYPPHDSPTVRELASGDRFIVNLPPSPAVLADVGVPFLALIDERSGELRRRYSVRFDHGVPVMEGGVPTHTELLAPKLYQDLNLDLRDAGLAVGMPDPTGLDSTYLHPRLADVYMAALAEQMARVNRLHPVSQQPAEHLLAMSGITVERLAQALLELKPRPLAQQEVETAMSLVTLRAVVPKGLSEVSVETLLAFRKKHRRELTAHQRFIADLVAPGGPLEDVPGTYDTTMMAARLQNAFERDVAPELEVLKRSLRRIGVDAVESAVSLSLPRLVKIAVRAVATAVQPAVALESLGSFGLMTFKVARAAESAAGAEIEVSPAAFLMYAQEELTPRSLLQRLGTSARRLAIGH